MKNGNLDFQEGLFLGKEELDRQQDFMQGNTLSILKKFGSKGLFEVFQKWNLTIDNTRKTITLNGQKGIFGFDTQERILFFNRQKTAPLGFTAPTTIYVGLEFMAESVEEGTISILSDGTVSGVGTEFTKIFRTGDKANRLILLDGTDRIFGIGNVSSDTSMTVVGENVTNIANVNFGVVGTFSPYVISSGLPYLYNSYKLVTSSQPFNETTQFQIGTITWSGSTPTFNPSQNEDSRLIIASEASGVKKVEYIEDTGELVITNITGSTVKTTLPIPELKQYVTENISQMNQKVSQLDQNFTQLNQNVNTLRDEVGELSDQIGEIGRKLDTINGEVI